MDIFTVAFFGHRFIEKPAEIEKRLDKHIRSLLAEHEYVDFLVGRNGDFDQYASSVVLRVRKRCGNANSSLILVLPYPTAEFINNEEYFRDYYTDIEISCIASMAYPKAAIRIRNREMADRADLILSFTERKSGGAWDSVKYALSQGKKVINLAEDV